MSNHTISVLSILIQDLPIGTNLALFTFFVNVGQRVTLAQPRSHLPGVEIDWFG